ncbi:glycosyltransferase family 4 protein [Allosediminivita pacifica]|uniref:Glycosyltransferase involved in cell wall biosynthesis n=1 Tax=Allosediminivita pacifica TaxID=1267769 RepID=A0A2T6B5G0_9RHOB|nr:glycosyltransferase family 4 protein [Allosediminivita pacifica]PTX51287.1 glycosyltransferase involved in cell wall biosynthesis [Allosediminivita pacifica]GGA98586.1 glycoside hydrolase [Allosediminivita pacifica]
MRILLLAPQPFFVPRGTPIAVRALLQVLTSQGHRCDAITFPEGEDPQIEGCRILRIPTLPGTRNMPPGFSAKKVIADMGMTWLAFRQMRRERYDLVIGVEEAAFIAMMLRPVFKVPYVYDMDSSIPEQMDDKFGLPAWLRNGIARVEGRAARKSIGALTCCRALQTTVESYAPGLPVQTIEDVSLIETPGEPPADCRFDEPVVMYVGNLEGYQGVDLLIRGFAEALDQGRRARLVIIGGTDAHVAAHAEIARELGVQDSVSLLGPRPVERIADYLGQADIVASPRTQGRNTPMKVYSYLDSGKPLIATRLPTHTQVLDDEISMLVAPDAADMARGLGALLDSPQLRDRLAASAKQRVAAEFSPEAYRRKLTGFFDRHIMPQVAGRAKVQA